MKSLQSIALFVILVNLAIKSARAHVKFTNIKCESFDKTFCEFSQCELKVLGRGIIGCSVYIKVHQLPLEKIAFAASLNRKFNGYRPFLYNITFNFCEFMIHPRRYPWFQLTFNAIRNFSNFNHKCPMNHDISVSKMILKDEMFAQIPLPSGSYMIDLLGMSRKKQLGQVNVFFDVEGL